LQDKERKIDKYLRVTNSAHLPKSIRQDQKDRQQGMEEKDYNHFALSTMSSFLLMGIILLIYQLI